MTDVVVMYLVQDGLLVDQGPSARQIAPGVTSQVIMSGVPQQKAYLLTDKGRDFVSRWFAAEPLD